LCWVLKHYLTSKGLQGNSYADHPLPEEITYIILDVNLAIPAILYAPREKDARQTLAYLEKKLLRRRNVLLKSSMMGVYRKLERPCYLHFLK
jgi:hypothetical protein